jgi:hypothetical protein
MGSRPVGRFAQELESSVGENKVPIYKTFDCQI